MCFFSQYLIKQNYKSRYFKKKKKINFQGHDLDRLNFSLKSKKFGYFGSNLKRMPLNSVRDINCTVETIENITWILHNVMFTFDVGRLAYAD